MHDLVQGANLYKIEKSVRLNLKDYKGESRHVDLVKVTSQGGVSVLVISDTLSYQSHVPFQTLLHCLRIQDKKFNSIQGTCMVCALFKFIELLIPLF